MNSWELLEETRWEIIEELARGPKYMSAIAKKTGTTVANVSQHLKVLDAFGYVKKEKESTGRPGKPKTLYSLKKSIAFIGLANPQMAGRTKVESADKYQSIILRVLLASNSQHSRHLWKLLLYNEEFMDFVDAAGLFKTKKDKIELFIVTEEPGDFREKYSNFESEVGGDEKKIVCWSHTKKEIEAGVENGDDHYKNLVSNSAVLYDPKDFIQRWKK